MKRIKEAKERLKYLLYDPDPKNPNGSDEIESGTEFIVTLPNGKKIGCKNASDTFGKTMVGLGIKRVMKVVQDLDLSHNGIPIVDTVVKHRLYEFNRNNERRPTKLGCFHHEHEGITYYIITNMKNDKKEEFLLEIAKSLDVSLKIDRPQKETISNLI